MTRAHHLLYVAWGFPPCRSGGVYRALATANAFAAAGWRVTVLTAQSDDFVRYTGVDPSLEDQIDPSVDVIRIPFRWPAQETDIRSYSRLRVTAPPVWRRLRAWQDQVAFPEVGYGPWRRPLENAAASVHEREPVDLVLATANPYVTFAAARLLHRQGVPYVLDYRDAWLLDVFSGRRLHAPFSRQARWERREVTSAAEVWFVNQPILDWHAGRYPAHADRMHVVANGWDPKLLDDVRTKDATPTIRNSLPSQVPRFGYLGTVTLKVPLPELLAGWRTAKTTGQLPADATLTIGGYLGYFAAPQAESAQLLAAARDVGVSYVGPVAKREAARFYRDIDVLVLALGTGRYVTSGKVFEYMATGKPIVSVHDPGNAASSILTGYPSWSPVADLTPGEVARVLGEGARRIGDDGAHRDALAFSEAFRRDAQLEPRLSALARVAARRS